MAIQAIPAYLQNASHSAALFRQAMSNPYVAAGILAPGELAVGAQATPNMSVQVGAGRAKVAGSQISPPTLLSGGTASFTTQAMYDVLNDSSVTLTIATADPTNPRIDTVYVAVQDSYYSGANNQAVLGVVTGTPAPSPVAPAAPSNSLIIGLVAVAANATSIVTGNISWSGTTIAQMFGGGSLTGALAYQGIYSAGSPTPTIRMTGSRIYLDGTVTSSSATFVTGTSYTLLTLPTGFGPATAETFICTSNQTAVAAVTVTTGGIVSIKLNVGFGPAALQLSLAGCNWPIAGY